MFFFPFGRHLGSQLCELEKLIDKMMIAEFSTYSHSDLNRPLEGECQVLEEVCVWTVESKNCLCLLLFPLQLQFITHSFQILVDKITSNFHVFQTFEALC